MFKDLVVPITGTPGDVDALDSAIALAVGWDAHLAILDMLDLPIPVNGLRGLWPDVMTHVRERLRQVGCQGDAGSPHGTGEDRFRLERLSPGDGPFSPWRVATRFARCSDLAVMAGPTDDASVFRETHACFCDLLLASGRPVLVVPPGRPLAASVRRVVVAWAPGRGATRALHDALPLLRNAQAVHVLGVHSHVDPQSGGEGEAAIGAHLARHGVRAEVAAMDSRDRGVDGAIIEFACTDHADLIVAGGYGHSRAREWLLGGVTRALFTRAPMPVFYSN